MILSKSKLHPAKMIQTGTSGEERNDLADDTNDAVDDIVAGLITADPIFGLAPIREFWDWFQSEHFGTAIIGQIWTLPALHPKKANPNSFFCGCVLLPYELFHGMNITPHHLNNI